MRPTLIITRPAHVAQATLDDYRAAIATPFDAILSPLIEIVDCDPEPFDQTPDHVIFTSANAVAHAARIGVTRDALAWCVGARTAQAAQNAGFKTRSVDGNGQDLLNLIRRENPQGSMLHIHGRETHLDFAAALPDQCSGICVYDQTTRPLSDDARAALTGTARVIVPLYSPNTASRLFSQTQVTAPASFVAISAQVRAAGLPFSDPEQWRVAASPDHQAMIDATQAALAALSG
ncbi:uroporphyrinogen-III synthase [Yoonia sp. 208BN28-4]|uniref:uroporphyrinogen-III synthase n=1 Tax=Yoonia sp. 208BN28-4 TaxID=3126505 RepID=UPI00309C4507